MQFRDCDSFWIFVPFLRESTALPLLCKVFGWRSSDKFLWNIGEITIYAFEYKLRSVSPFIFRPERKAFYTFRKINIMEYKYWLILYFWINYLWKEFLFLLWNGVRYFYIVKGYKKELFIYSREGELVGRITIYKD